MASLHKAGVALLALLAFAAVASARPLAQNYDGPEDPYPDGYHGKDGYGSSGGYGSGYGSGYNGYSSGDKHDKKSVGDHVKYDYHKAKAPKGPKEIILYPKVSYHAVRQHGKPEKPQKTIFILNNTHVEVHRDKVKEEKPKEEPIKDYTKPIYVEKEKPKTEFIFNATYIKVHQDKVKIEKPKEEPVFDYTQKQEFKIQKPRTEFIKNYTYIEHEKPEKEIKVKEAPIKDITEKPDKEAWKYAEKEAKEEHKYEQKYEQDKWNHENMGYKGGYKY